VRINLFSYQLHPKRRFTDQFDTQHRILVGLVILCGALLRLLLLTNQSLWYDEGQSLVVTDSKTLFGTFYELSARAGGDKYQPLYYFVLSIWRSILGDSEYSLRLLSVLPGVVALYFMYAAVANVYGSRHALWSTTYLAVSAFLICYSQEVRPYSLLFLLGAIQLFLLSSIFAESENPKTMRIILFALFTGLSCFASILLAAFSIALALAHLTIVDRTYVWFKWWIPAVIACLPAGIYLMGTPAVGELSVDSTNGLGLPLYKNGLFAVYGILVGHTYGPPLDALRETGNLAGNIFRYGWQLSMLGIASLVLCAGFVSSQLIHFKVAGRDNPASGRRCVKRNRFFLVLFTCSVLMAMLVAKVSAINWMPRHSFYLAIPVAVLLPLTFMLKNPQYSVAQKRIGQSAQGAFIALLAMNVYASYNYFYKSEYWRDDYRSAARYLVNNSTETDRAIMLWGEPRLLSYYGDTSTQDRWEIDPPPVSSVMDGVYSDGGKVFVAINREFTWSRSLPTSDSLETQVANKYNLISVERYVNFNIYEFETNASSTEINMPLTSGGEATLQVM